MATRKQIWTPEQWIAFCTRCQETRTAMGDLIRAVEQTPGLYAKILDRMIRTKDSFIHAMIRMENVLSEKIDAYADNPLALPIRLVHGPQLNLHTYSRERRNSKEPLTREEWSDVGGLAKAIRDQVRGFIMELSTVLPVNHRAIKGFEKVERDFARVRSDLDSICCRQHPDWKEFVKVFYGYDEPDTQH